MKSQEQRVEDAARAMWDTVGASLDAWDSAHGLTELSLRIESLRDELLAAHKEAPTGPVTAALGRAERQLSEAVAELDPYIGRAARADAHGSRT